MNASSGVSLDAGGSLSGLGRRVRTAGQIAVVTGAASGIGRDCDLALGFAGRALVNHLPRDEVLASELARQVENAGGGLELSFAADVNWVHLDGQISLGEGRRPGIPATKAAAGGLVGRGEGHMHDLIPARQTECLPWYYPPSI